MRILITGSRDWNEPALIQKVLENVHRERMLSKSLDVSKARNVVLVSGACPTGADRQAEGVARGLDWGVERHPAKWDTLGRRAGFVRNAEMVRLGADVCFAFIRNNSRGASMTAELAQKSGIKTEIFRID